MEDEFSDGDICGVWVYVGDTHQPTSQSGTDWFSNQSFGEGMKSYDETAAEINASYKQTQDVDKTAKEVGVSRLVVIEALGFSDEWSFIFDDE